MYHPENRNLFSDTYLADQFQPDSAGLEHDSRIAYAALRELRNSSKPSRFTEGQEQQLREEYLDKVLDILGWSRSGEGRIPGDGKPDYTLFQNPEDKDAALSHVGKLEFFQDAICLCEAKPWETDLHRTVSEGRSARGQIYGYLEDTHLPWGFATNGRAWMLVWREYSRAQQRDYTVDLDALLQSEAWSPEFNYFFGFFSKAAFAEGLPLLAIERSRTAGEAVGQNLKSNVYEALLTLGRSIYHAGPTEFQTDAQLDRLKAECLVFLYRLLFVNFAESRRLLPMRDSDLYRRSFSLLRVKESIQAVARGMREEEYLRISDTKSDYFRNIKKLFGAIDRGLPMAQIPPYNGGLFRAEDHPFLESVDIDDRTVARVVDLLSRTRVDPDRFVDYSYLGVRELGSIYEGLLEYQFRVANQDLIAASGTARGTEVWIPRSEEGIAQTGEPKPTVATGELYLATAKGERKATGSFYTPDEVVRYIVRECLGPVVRKRLAEASEKKEDLPLALLKIKVVDPAMGSGHFLVAATEYLAEQLLGLGEENALELKSSGIQEDELEAWAKRQIVSHCIYGVDLNPMAVELAKVSLWLTTFSRGHPLTFLDHRLKSGNSLLGARLEELPAYPRSTARAKAATTERASRVKPFDVTGIVEEFRGPIESIDSIDEVRVADVERKKELYLQFIQSPRYQRLFLLANAHAALSYSPPPTSEVDPGQWDAFVRAAVEPDGTRWDSTAHPVLGEIGSDFASRRLPFHWDLAFPEVFGRASPGFDAVIGNPPYVRIYRGQLSVEDVAYFQRRFKAAHMKFDLYVLFLELGINLLRRGGRLGFIVPDKFTTSPYGEPVRGLILRNKLVSILDLRKERVFPGVAVSPLILIVESGAPRDSLTEILAPASIGGSPETARAVGRVAQTVFEEFPQRQIRIDASFSGLGLLRKISAASFPLSRAYYVNWGLRTGTKERTERLITANPAGSNPKPLLRGEDLRDRYILERPSRFIDYDVKQLYNPMFPELFESPKVVYRKISGPEGLRAIFDESAAYCFCTLICAVNLTATKGVNRPGVGKPTREAKRFREPTFVLAVSNSKLVAWWYSQTHSDKLGVNPAHVQAIPLPTVLLDVPPVKSPPALSDLLAKPVETLVPELLEAVVAQGGAKLQTLGDQLFERAEKFVQWLSRELGSQVLVLFRAKVIEFIETTDEAGLVHSLENLHRSSPLRLDPHNASTQDALLREYRSLREHMARVRREMLDLDRSVELSIHRLFGLTPEESATVA